MSYTDELWNSETRVFCRLYSLYIYIRALKRCARMHAMFYFVIFKLRKTGTQMKSAPTNYKIDALFLILND